MGFPDFGRNIEEYMAKKGTPVKRVVLNQDGVSHIEVPVPGPDYPERKLNLTQKGFDGTSLLPGAHVGDASVLPGLPSGGVAGGREVVDGDYDGLDWDYDGLDCLGLDI